MKKFIKFLGYFLLLIIILGIGGFIYFNSTYPKAGPAPNTNVEITQARLERGKYLANHVTVCMDCHSTRDWTKYSGPIISGTEGKGGEKFGEELGLPGTIYSKNITPANLNDWTDGEIIRAITSGVTKDGTTLFPLMSYLEYQNLSKEDLYSIVAYIRTLKPIKNEVPESQVKFPVSLIIKTLPQPYIPKKEPDINNPERYGKYLVTIAGCAGCHTPAKDGEPIKGMEFAGGEEFNTPWGTIRTANISPDMTTGIGSWTKEMFISRFKSFDSDSAKSVKVNGNEFNTVMPWTLYSGMTEEDLTAIYTYLRTVKPVQHAVNRYSPSGQNMVSN
jgi:mono/diheme cytochrome c family protein